MVRRTLELPLAADRNGPEPLTSQLAGQLLALGHRISTSPSRIRLSVVPHSGQTVGI